MGVTQELRLDDVEWVAEHHEAHGQLLVRGATLSDIITKATTALLDRLPRADTAAAHLRLVNAGWWCATTCECRRGFASSNHPAWHYRRSHPGDAGSWYGAEVRFSFGHQRPTPAG